MQALERRADASGHSYALMMELAGQAVATAVVQRLTSSQQQVLALVGPGNNGGDGLVCARHLHQAGIAVRAYLWKRRTTPQDDYEQHYTKLMALGVPSCHADDDANFAVLRQWLAESDVIIDALLGTGANRPIDGQLAEMLQLVQDHLLQSHCQDRSSLVVAVDCPSGLNCDNGAADPYTLPATLTVTFAHAKLGHYHFPGAELCGQVEVADIGIAPALSRDLPHFLLCAGDVRRWLPPRPRLSHKGSFGKLLAVVGSVNYPGAATLSLAAAGRVGAGLLTGAVVEPIWPIVAGHLTEPTWLPLPAKQGYLLPQHAAPLRAASTSYDALLVGCGLGNRPQVRDFLAEFFARLVDSLPDVEAPKSPVAVIDADALNCLAQIEDWPRLLPPSAILTPHPAEMARLCRCSVTEVVQNRWELARQQARAWQVVILLKGPYTVIAAPAGWLAVLPIATPALATAGTGDVLAGAIAGLAAQGVAPFAAACLGAWLHGQAGLRCAAEIGQAGVLASDVAARLPTAIADLVDMTSLRL
jgi:NAD(P)H-hydrate epimerase